MLMGHRFAGVQRPAMGTSPHKVIFGLLKSGSSNVTEQLARVRNGVSLGASVARAARLDCFIASCGSIAIPAAINARVVAVPTARATLQLHLGCDGLCLGVILGLLAKLELLLGTHTSDPLLLAPLLAALQVAIGPGFR